MSPVSPALPPLSTSGARSATLLAGLLDHFETIELTASGECMSPAVQPGERVTVAAARFLAPRFGDVVLVRQREGLRLHRLVWAPPGPFSWRTQADRAGALDPRIRREDVLGTVVSVDGAPGRRTRRSGLALASLARAVRLRLGRPWIAA